MPPFKEVMSLMQNKSATPNANADQCMKADHELHNKSKNRLHLFL